MNVLVVAPYACNPYLFETDLELAQTHIDAGDNVTMLECRGQLAACDANIDHQPEACLICISRRKSGVNALSQPVQTRPLVDLDKEDCKIISKLETKFSDSNVLKTYKIDGLDVGYAVCSSLISHLRDPYPSLTKHSDRIRRLTIASVSVFLSIKRLLSTRSFDRVYVFNGRHAPLRAVLRGSQESSVDCFLHERGSTLLKYALFENALPHDILNTEILINDAWESVRNKEEKERVAQEFYSGQAKGISKNWFSFVDHQERGRLPDEWNPDNNKVVIYTSSEDELVSVSDEWQNPIYPDQVSGIEKIIGEASSIPGLHLVIRIHPNLRNQNSEDVRRTLALQGDGVDVIPAESVVDSYELLRHADRVLTFGSSMGIEAAYWGKPSISAGNCFYRRLGSTYNPTTHEELMDLLTRSIRPLDNLGATKYGYYRATFGTPYRYYSPTEIFEGKFRGKVIAPGKVARLIRRGLQSPPGRPIRAVVRSIALRRMNVQL